MILRSEFPAKQDRAYKQLAVPCAGYLKDCGLYFIANQDYMSRVRGGNNYYQLCISDHQPLSFKQFYNILIPLNVESIGLHKGNLVPGGRIIIDKHSLGIIDDNPAYIDVPLHSIAMDIGGEDRYFGTVALGVLCGMFLLDAGVVERTLRTEFDSKSKEIADKNVACAYKGIEIGKKQCC